MKRFFGVLLFTIIVSLVFFFIGSVFTRPCDGAEITVEVTAEIVRPRLTISDPIPGNMVWSSYPDEVYHMSAREFYTWATEQNAKTRVEWDEWHKTAPPRWLSYGVTDYERHGNSQRTDRGTNGYGYRHRYNTSGRMYGSGYGSGYGSTRTYAKRFLNPDYVSRPLAIINPYCPPAQ